MRHEFAPVLTLSNPLHNFTVMDPAGIIDAVDNIFKTANDLVMGRNGIVTKFDLPFVGAAVSRELKAGSSDNFIEKVIDWLYCSVCNVLLFVKAVMYLHTS